jgi:hypothetical protein
MFALKTTKILKVCGITCYEAGTRIAFFESSRFGLRNTSFEIYICFRHQVKAQNVTCVCCLLPGANLCHQTKGTDCLHPAGRKECVFFYLMMEADQ